MFDRKKQKLQITFFFLRSEKNKKKSVLISVN